MGLNKKSVDDINAKGKRVLVRCDFNVPLKNGEITDVTMTIGLQRTRSLLSEISHLLHMLSGTIDPLMYAPCLET